MANYDLGEGYVNKAITKKTLKSPFNLRATFGPEA
jgi:hypothetical protein